MLSLSLSFMLDKEFALRAQPFQKGNEDEAIRRKIQIELGPDLGP